MFLDFSLNEIKQKIAQSILRFPWVILIITLCTVFSWILIYDPKIFEDYKNMTKILSCLFLGIPFSIGLTLLKETSFKSIFKFQLDVLGLLLGVLTVVFFVLPDAESSKFVYKLVQLAFIAHLFVSLAPFLRISKNENLDFWSYNYFLLFRILKANVYALTFWIGLALAIVTVNLLFKTNFTKAFGYLAIFVTVIFQTWFFVAGIPENIRTLNINFKYPNELRIFTQFALVPITVVYLIILYAYSLKILIQWNLPSGHIGWLVSSISILGAFTLLLIHPLRQSPEHKWINMFWKYYFVLILPLLGLLLWALSIRIYSYGITESRFVLMMCGLTLAALSLYFILNKHENIKWIPFSLFFISLLTVAGPLDATRISFNSQFKRFKDLVAKNNINSLDAIKNMTSLDANNLSSKIYYLRKSNLEKFESYIDENFTWLKLAQDKSLAVPDRKLIEILLDELSRNHPADIYSGRRQYTALENKSKEPFSTAEAKEFFILNLTSHSNKKTIININSIEWSVELVGDQVGFNNTKTEEIFSISFEELFNLALKEKNKPGYNIFDTLPKENTSYQFAFKGLKGTLILNSLNFIIDNDDRKIQELNGILLIRSYE